jgi:GT2 family glycosyltransferase
MTVTPPLSIIIAYHASPSFLSACLDSLINTIRLEDEIIVVVNNVNKDVHSVNIFSERVKYINYYENLGHAKAINLGVKHAANDYVILSDHDLVYQENWLKELWKLYKSDDTIGAVSCKILNTSNDRILDYGIAYSDFNLGHPFMDLQKNHPLVMENNISQMICTGGFLINKNLFFEVGALEEKFGSLYTDLDLCLKIKRKGLKVGAVANAKAYHFGGDFSFVNRSYKANHLKADVKGVFMRNNADVLESDMKQYYELSINYFKKEYGDFEKYFFCNMMNVVFPKWYENILEDGGIERFDRYQKPSGARDAYTIGIFEILGYDIMNLGVPIAYFVDRFVCIKGNAFWWSNRRSPERDIVVDRNGNIVPIKEIIH